MRFEVSMAVRIMMNLVQQHNLDIGPEMKICESCRRILWKEIAADSNMGESASGFSISHRDNYDDFIL